jgi:hypothetical protein
MWRKEVPLARRCRLLEIGTVPPNLTWNLKKQLESIQDAYTFDFDGTRLSVPFWLRRADSAWDGDKLERLIVRYMGRRRPEEHPVGITQLRLPDDTFSSSDEEVALLSIHGWKGFSKREPIDGLAYLVAGALLDWHLETPVHQETRECPNDYCEALSDVDRGMNRGALCEDCTGVLLQGIATGKLSVNEAMAIQRILDFVARRRVLCVIMPLAPAFDGVYKSVVEAASQTGFECTRADEVRQTAPVMQSVSAMIRRAELIVADITGSNANVLYELGEAHATGKNTILMCQSEPSKMNIPFDLRHLRCIAYQADGPGLQALEKELERYMTQSRPARVEAA